MINRQNLGYRFQQFLILIAHLLLLWWILHTLGNSGQLPVMEMLYHFIGMSLYGALLIRGTAYWAHYHFVKEVSKKRRGQR